MTDFYIDPDFFWWSGGNNDADRRQAAADLKDWVDTHLVTNGKLWLICHSHGGNVALIASALGLKIDRLIMMGTPIRTDYTPNIKNISALVNLYVPWDAVQTGGAIGRMRGEGRTLADSASMYNRAARGSLVTGGLLGWKQAHSDIRNWNVWIDLDNRFDRFLQPSLP